MKKPNTKVFEMIVLKREALRSLPQYPSYKGYSTGPDGAQVVVISWKNIVMQGFGLMLTTFCLHYTIVMSASWSQVNRAPILVDGGPVINGDYPV